jgi:DNA-binding NarL/FixJ family response regulator
MKPKLILADDHPLLMEGAKQHLLSHGYKILATCNNGNDAYLAILKFSPDIAILDMDMPILSGLDVAAQVKKNNLDTKIVILTLYKQEAILAEVGQSIEGYVTKDSTLEEIDTCLQKVSAGETYISSKLKGNLALNTSNKNVFALTPTEVKILKLIKQNLTSAEVADQLFISKRTVEKHRSNIVQKLGLESTHSALILWLSKNALD